MISILLLLLGSLHPAYPYAHTVDKMELNHYYDDDGQLVFSQMIYYDWSRQDNRFHVIAWRLCKSREMIPLRIQGTTNYRAIWRDGDIIRHTHTTLYVETWTQHDPEIKERTVLPKEYRKGFIKRRERKD